MWTVYNDQYFLYIFFLIETKSTVRPSSGMSPFPVFSAVPGDMCAERREARFEADSDITCLENSKPRPDVNNNYI